jgi:hypothetical protein
MAEILGLGLGLHRRPSPPDSAERMEHVIVQRPLHRVMAFTRRTIDDIVNDPIAKNEVIGYYKLHRQVERWCEIVELERWWNGR